MADTPSMIQCPKCGKLVPNQGNFCTYCAAPLIRTVEETEQKEPDQSVGYWNFYGAAPEEEPPETGMSTVGKLRLAAVICLIAGLIIGFALTISDPGYGLAAEDIPLRWEMGLPYCIGGVAVFAILLSISFIVKPDTRNKKE